jgi:hypothetical protein
MSVHVLTGQQMTVALEGYVRRARRGADDAALVAGTGKDLLEAVAAHIIQQRTGTYPSTANFPTLLGQAFITLGLATPEHPTVFGESPLKRIERAMFELACGVNQLRNKQGTGHGRPWSPTVTDAEARAAIEAIGLMAGLLLSVHAARP